LQNCNTGTAHYQKTVDPVGQPKCKKNPKPQIKNTTKKPPKQAKKRKRKKIQSTHTT